MSIERSSKLIKSLYIDDEDVDLETLNFRDEAKKLFSTFFTSKQLSIDLDSLEYFLNKFNKIHQLGIFANFKPPMIQEYFCKQLNFLLIIDFIITFFKTGDEKFDIQKINTQFIFDFFIKLGDFYNFMNYLEVEDKFLNYLKYMITLYSFQLDRNIIENVYHSFIYIIDDFFKNEIMSKAFSSIKYKNYDHLEQFIKEFYKKFPNEINSYNKNVNYQDSFYDYLDSLFILNKTWDNLPHNVSTITKTIEVPNPNPPPPINNTYTATFNTGTEVDNADIDEDNYYSDYESDYGSDDENDEYNYTRRQQWTPTIRKLVPLIENTDSNYNEYKKLFILRNYQKIKNKYDVIRSEIEEMCKNIQLKKYDDFEPENKNIEILKIKTILGIMLDYTKINDNDCNKIFELACEFGHIEIVKKLIIKKNGDIGDLHFEKAITSPNQEISKYLEENKKKFPELNKLFKKYKEANYCEPKIRFH
jgi:hypothetical protein